MFEQQAISDGTRYYDALVVVSFGGPDGPADVLPFLENVLRGRNVPRERMLAVAEHYYHFGGGSPINEQNRRLIAAIERELAEHGPQLPVYWGNRNWHPLLADTLRQMAADGVKRALAFVTSGFSSYSGCRQYRENIAAAQAEVGPAAPVVDKLRVFFNHPGFIEPMIELTRTALEQVPAERRSNAVLIFTAHSIPLVMAQGCRYEEQLREACRLIAEGVNNASPGRAGVSMNWHLVYQSRSGPPHQPWLEPDINDYFKETPCYFKTDGCGCRPRWFHFRSHGSAVRSGHGSATIMRASGNQHGPRRHGRHPPAVRADDSRAHRRANGRLTVAAGARHTRARPRYLPGRLLPEERGAGGRTEV